MTATPAASAPPVRLQELELEADDGFVLAGTEYAPVAAPRATAVIHGATAVPRRFYDGFARFLAGAGYRVVTYDYRGVGGSRPESLVGFRARMRDWAQLDAAAALGYIDRAPAGPLIAIGHSFGGQLIGLLDRAREVHAQVLVASQLGSYRNWPALAQPKLMAVWHGLVPVATAAFGYLPGKAGLGVDLPAGVAREWAAWCRSPGYLVDHVDGAAARFASLTAPTLLYSFTDDAYAPPRAVDALVDRLTGAELYHRSLHPREAGLARVGHFGFFRAAAASTLWEELRDQLDRVVATGHFASGAPLEAARDPARDVLWSITPEEIRRDLESRGPS